MQSRILGLLCPAALILFMTTLGQAQGLDTLKLKAEADSLVARADSLKQAGQVERALNLYKSALIGYEQLGDKINQAKLNETIAICYYWPGKNEEAQFYFEKQLELEREIGNSERECITLRRIGLTFANLYDNATATTYFMQSLDLARKIENRRLEAIGVWCLAAHYDNIGRWDSSLVLCKQSLTIFRELNDQKQEGFALNLMGTNSLAIGKFSDALNYLQQSLSIFKALKDTGAVAMAYGNIGVVYDLLGDHAQALDYHLKVADIHMRSGDTLRIAGAHQAMAGVYCQAHNYAQAVMHCQEALGTFEAVGNKVDACKMHDKSAIAYAGLGNFSRAFENFRKAVEIAREIGDIGYEGYALEHMADAYYQDGQYEKAIKCYQSSLALAPKIREIDTVQDGYDGLGDCYSVLGRDSLALVYYQKYINIVENIRERQLVESHKSLCASNIIPFYGKVALLMLKSDKTADAFNYSERGRARSFLDLLASAQVKVGKPEHQEFLAKENELADQKEEIEQQMAAAGEDTAQVVALRGKLEGDWGEVLASLEEQKREEPELASLVSVNPLTLPEVQKLLDKETTLLEYFLTKEKTLLWLVTRKDTDVFQVDIGGDSLKNLVMGFRQAIRDQSETDQLSCQLYNLLLAPAADKIKTGNLIIVPHGILHYLPFAALQDAKGRCLLEDYRIRYLPSASVLKYLPSKRRGRGESLLALGNPTTDCKGYAAIPLTETEVAEIGLLNRESQVLTGAQATETEFKRLAPQSDILHLACHGDLNSAYPMFSCLLLAPDSLEDGELAVHEIFNLDLQVSLVVLSGCQTGLGHLTNGDELVGLSRAFIYAGTPSIVSSLWMVEDESTAYLMGRFYHHLQKHDKAQALRQAQLETRRKYPGLRSWASFVLTGEGM